MEFPEALAHVLRLARLKSMEDTRSGVAYVAKVDLEAIKAVETFALNYTTIRVKPSTTAGD